MKKKEQVIFCDLAARERRRVGEKGVRRLSVGNLWGVKALRC